LALAEKSLALYKKALSLIYNVKFFLLDENDLRNINFLKTFKSKYLWQH